MEIIQYNLNDSFAIPKNFYRLYNNLPFALFDIETTGLNPQYNKVILIGILYYKENKLTLEQLFCHSKDEEPYLLEEFIRRIKEVPMLISYNGDSFDIPFLNKRIQVNKIDNKLPSFVSFDLLKLVRAYKTQFNLENCKLKSVERYLGIEREDQISGKESVDLYNKFEITKDKSLKDLILLHNHDDLRYLLQVMKVLDDIPYNKLIGSVPHILNTQDQKVWIINKVHIKSNTLIASGLLLCDTMKDYIVHKQGFSFDYINSNNSFLLKIPLYKTVLNSSEKCFYINMNDYPFEYSSKSEINTIAPNHIIILKKDKKEYFEDIYGFLKELLQILFNIC